MDATPENIEELRLKLGEAIPAGGSEGDTLFTNAHLERILLSAPFMGRATLEGWQIKAAHFAGLVNVTDGAASREFSDLLDNANQMVRMYSRVQEGPTEGRTRVGRIIRR